ncbi:MAG TPA: hypothetical protein ENH91_08735 [Leeuwenhoekiella sp.]|nr:hypothetical protein [Leeuwenhoekiella sp.]
MKKLAMLALVLGLATSCQAQDKNQGNMAKNQTESHKKPNEQWTVNKEVDKNGNIVKYDSIYSWSSSGNTQMMNQQGMDSIMHSFTSQFQEGMPNETDSFFENFFNNDQGAPSDFFQNFFSQDSISENQNIEVIRQQMEALQQRIMTGLKPQPIIPAEPEKAPKKSQ